VFVGVPGDATSAIQAAIVAVLDDGSVCRQDWGLTPLHSLTDAVELQVTEHPPTRRVSVRAIADGHVVEDVQMRMYSASLGVHRRVRSGTEVTVPCGEYTVVFDDETAALKGLRHEVQIEPSPISDLIPIEVDLGTAVGVLELYIGSTTGSVDSNILVSFDMAGGSSLTLASWHSGCDRDPIRLLLPAGRTRVTAGGLGYGKASTDLQIAPGPHPLVARLVVPMQ
jgi:hypothetical protein